MSVTHGRQVVVLALLLQLFPLLPLLVPLTMQSTAPLRWKPTVSALYSFSNAAATSRTTLVNLSRNCV